jgi:hypothetical protein
MQRLGIGIIAATTFLSASCSKETEYTPEQRVCIGKMYMTYDPKNIGQCVAVCKGCMKGNIVTCNTSCKLKGAS